jgi:hypothetical protein
MAMFSSFVSSLRSIAIATASIVLICPALLAQTSPSVVPSRIAAPIDETARVALHGYVHPLANAANDRGVAPDSMPLTRIQPPSSSSSPTPTTPPARITTSG